MTKQELYERLRARMRGEVVLDRALAPLTTYRLGGRADVYVEPADGDDVVAAAEVLSEEPSTPLLVLGRGSNLVVSDEGWPGVVLRLGPSFSWVHESASGAAGLRAGAATPLPFLANWAARRGLAGVEFTIAIPGSVGGSVKMNAGAHGRCMADCLDQVSILNVATRQVESRSAAALDLDYRRSGLGDDEVVLEASLSLSREDPGAVRERMEAYRRHRAETQPGAAQNAGSVFKNPPGDSAGRLVEAAGLKGFRVGGAAVSDLHANFFIAGEGASAQDVRDLVAEVRRRVNERFGIDLEPEIHFVGRFDDGVAR
ncbi:MAG TPA: UDP-N-acetylmuramate dehydrogenase [Actinomycetota bacterium]|nr:UDP-N-acetylmuramate dehydrogenase [Actinomycetota bacterium]